MVIFKQRGAEVKKKINPGFWQGRGRLFESFQLEGFRAQFLARALSLKNVGSTLNFTAGLFIFAYRSQYIKIKYLFLGGAPDCLFKIV